MVRPAAAGGAVAGVGGAPPAPVAAPLVLVASSLKKRGSLRQDMKSDLRPVFATSFCFRGTIYISGVIATTAAKSTRVAQAIG